MGLTVREAQNKIDSAEFAEWMAYFVIEPFGEERADLRAGIISATVANSNRSRRSKAYKPKDFMPRYDRHAMNKTQNAMMVTWKSFVKAQNGFVKGKAS